MTELNPSRENLIKKRKQALTKINSLRKEFEKKEREMTAELDEARRIWRELSEIFRWWQSLP